MPITCLASAAVDAVVFSIANAMQIHDVARHYASGIMDVALCVRGVPLALHPDTGFVIATPGALQSYGFETLAAVATVVLDEADTLLAPEFRQVVKVSTATNATRSDQIRSDQGASQAAIQSPPPQPLIRQFRARQAQFVLVAATLSDAGTKSMRAVVRELFPQAQYILHTTRHRTVPTLNTSFGVCGQPK
jgi:superfamily II DNA/RNA helicase